MANKNNGVGLILAAILAIALLQYSGIFSIASFFGQPTQYYNYPVSAQVQTDAINPQFYGSYNEVPVNISVVSLANNTYSITYSGIQSEGIFKVLVVTTNGTFSQSIVVKAPFVTVNSNLPSTINKTGKFVIVAQLINPQGDLITNGNSILQVKTPGLNVETQTMIPNNNSYMTEYNFKEAGNYTINIIPSVQGYLPGNYTATVQVLTADNSYLYWIFGIAIVFVIFFVIFFSSGRR